MKGFRARSLAVLGASGGVHAPFAPARTLIFPLDAKGRLRRAPIKTWATDFTHSLFGALGERGGVGFLALRRGSGPDNHRFEAEVFQLTPRGLQQTGTKKEFELSP